jgi:NADPH-ferrihemoprotein reductase
MPLRCFRLHCHSNVAQFHHLHCLPVRISRTLSGHPFTMDVFSTWDLLFLKASLVAVLIAFGKSYIPRMLSSRKAPPVFPLLAGPKQDAAQSLPTTRSIKKRMQQTGKNCIIFYGSQTGTAEKFARRLAKETTTRFNLQNMIADLDDFDFDDLNALETQQLAIFVLATYGEGEPTDNAISFYNFLKRNANLPDGAAANRSLSQFRYVAFGLGNSSYQFYNSMILRTDEMFRSCGATRIGEVGLGDDGKGTLEEDFSQWKEKALIAIAEHFRLQELEHEFKPDFEVTESQVIQISDVFLGEPNKAQLRNKIYGPFTPQNPFPATIVEARELFSSKDRNCLHLEFDVSNTTLKYDTGDHLAVSPVNSELEVDRFLRVFGLHQRKGQIIEIRSYDPSVKVTIPSKTTYEAAARHYLDIGAAVTRQLLTSLSALTVREQTRSELIRLGSDKESFQREIAHRRLNLGQALSLIAPGYAFEEIPYSFILENVGRLQPRYYSISSSSLVSRKRISITAVVDYAKSAEGDFEFRGVNTSYLFALKSNFQATTPVSMPTPSAEASVFQQTHQISGPRGSFLQPTALIHVRQSKFRLPRNPSTPVIMIGPGTGVAPFRAFVQERALQCQAGRGVGRTILFYGCRRRDEDYLYKEEWRVR